MKIVVASMGNEVAGHFGHCENFIFFDTEDGKIVSENSVPNPGHRPDCYRTSLQTMEQRLSFQVEWAAEP